MSGAQSWVVRVYNGESGVKDKVGMDILVLGEVGTGLLLQTRFQKGYSNAR